jgi:hypothetical protein
VKPVFPEDDSDQRAQPDETLKEEESKKKAGLNP